MVVVLSPVAVSLGLFALEFMAGLAIQARGLIAMGADGGRRTWLPTVVSGAILTYVPLATYAAAGSTCPIASMWIGAGCALAAAAVRSAGRDRDAAAAAGR